ncbi:hypothetical protein [Kitasatospora aureofaciens]|uniref:hypothetical protein n=1 Tax=Kitasatospora aureofaciens TaxID=1894 RepID=UPI001C468A51|nr:hypothetical protein [Kitasatospora aureofaciens]MBV6701894.1 hypothetical protein [Kitasatospora aureofaciens]
METSTIGDRIPEEAVQLLEALLKDDEPVARALRAQIPHLRVTGHCPCPCPSIDFAPDRATVAAAPVTGNPVVEAEMLDADGRPVGGVLLFAFDGYLSNLEIYSWADEPITELPPPDRLA